VFEAAGREWYIMTGLTHHPTPHKLKRDSTRQYPQLKSYTLTYSYSQTLSSPTQPSIMPNRMTKDDSSRIQSTQVCNYLPTPRNPTPVIKYTAANLNSNRPKEVAIQAPKVFPPVLSLPAIGTPTPATAGVAGRVELLLREATEMPRRGRSNSDNQYKGFGGD
jgi:hypothetical protein